MQSWNLLFKMYYVTHFQCCQFCAYEPQRVLESPGLGLESRFLGLGLAHGLETCGLGLGLVTCGLGLDTSGLKPDFKGIFSF